MTVYSPYLCPSRTLRVELNAELEEDKLQNQQRQFHIAFDKNSPEIRKHIDKALQEASHVNKN
ncbi:hypothetical protein BGZ93_011279 [Podila epicladia]|nr:hypothetical protein BGZ93_011279 [Podila epicladia]